METQVLPGIGPTLAERLAARGLETLEDLAWFVPRGYDDLRDAVRLAAAEPGPRVTLVATVTRARYTRFRRRYLEVGLEDGGARATVRWFNVHPSMASRFARGARVILSGALRHRDGAFEMANPDLLGDADDEATSARLTLRPRYGEVEGVAPAIVRKAARTALERVAPRLQDGVPPDIAARLALPPLAEALRGLHDPPADLDDAETRALRDGDSPWHRRLAFDDLFFLALAVLRRRHERRRLAAPPCAAPAALADARAVLPFALTGAQERAAAAIVGDLAGERPMNRLLQGDVGAGKTAVAFVAAHAALAAGRQVALMAPTEILAEQHLRSIEPWARALGHRAALLTASTPRGVRETTLAMLAAGATGLCIGTHALLAERVGFADLGLCIIDEQHRFGVAQRVRLRGKGDGAPHLLVMTATPIPRTMALTIYGDLDVTTLDELPPGRTPPRTRICHGARGRAQIVGFLKRKLAEGARAFVVCPLVEPSYEPGVDWADATTTADHLAEALAPFRVGLVHGRVPAAERDAEMARLRRGDIDVLVATTVIEVGVDVPEATVMVVLDADRFGLAQLHQLRGRVGRGGGEAFCLLHTRASQGSERLAILADTCDGFRIAEADLALRGPGEVLGVRQAGLPKLRFGDLLAHGELLREARREAEALLAADPALAAHPATHNVLLERAPPYAGDGG
ncbi:MAG TPA: ATP-dependent DNA helicase RecG [Haliangiales bacterium]|nr:ATP-dependent DNA helicase RecG [Haliangiales bacterium]